MWHPLFRRRRYPSPFPILFILVATFAVIMYGRGYRPDFQTNSIKPTGLLSATSDPIGAQVYIDGALKTATNNSVNIEPGNYTVRITKEGYSSWEKKFRIQGEIASRTDAFLFLTNPSLSPITNTGIVNPIMSPDSTRLAYTVPLDYNNGANSTTKAGLWVHELTERPLGMNRDPRHLDVSTVAFDFSKAKIIWSPDSRELMVALGNRVRLYEISRINEFEDVTFTYTTILSDWEKEKQELNRQKLASFKPAFSDVLLTSAKIISFSPDESKLLYEATAAATFPLVIDPPLIGSNPTEEKRTIDPGKLYVYDSREDKNYFLLDKNEIPTSSTSPQSSPSPSPNDRKVIKSSPSPNLQPTTYLSAEALANVDNLQPYDIYWFPTSRHFVLAFPGKIDIMEYDRTNWVTVYSGPFQDDFIAPWPNGSRILILTNLNPGLSPYPNLYTVNLR